MTLFEPLYRKMLQLAAHRHAPKYLGAVSFAESSFFPIMPDIMLIPMTLSRPNDWKYLALLTTITSVLGGIAGYLIGYWLFDWLEPMIVEWGRGDSIELAKQWFAEWGVWIVFIAGFSPIPYKIFTITAGALSMAVLPFVIASLIGRGARFFLVAGVVALLGPKVEKLVLKYIEWLGWTMVALLAVVMLYMSFR